MEEIKCNQVATLRGGKWEKTYEESRRVYGIDGIAPTVHTQGGGNQETKILIEPLAYDEQNGYLREDGIVGTLTTDGSSPKHNNRVIEPIVYDGFNQQIKADREGLKVAEPVSTRGNDIASTLRASMHKQGERNLVENLKNGRGYEGVVEPTIWGSLQEHCAVKQDGVCPTLTQAMGAGGGQIPMTEVPANEYEKEINNGKEILCVLRKTFDEETLLKWGIGVLYAIIKTEILRQNMYAKGVLEDWERNADLSKFTSNSKESQRLDIKENEVRDLWEKIKIRCASLGRKLPEQRIEQFESFMQKLPLQATQEKIFVQSLWETNGWGIGLLQQALFAVQKIWQPVCCEEVQRNFRVRKLTEKEAFRLQGVKDEDFAKIRKNQSKSSCYHLAGDSITTSVLMALFGEMLNIDWKENVENLVEELQDKKS